MVIPPTNKGKRKKEGGRQSLPAQGVRCWHACPESLGVPRSGVSRGWTWKLARLDAGSSSSQAASDLGKLCFRHIFESEEEDATTTRACRRGLSQQC